MWECFAYPVVRGNCTAFYHIDSKYTVFFFCSKEITSLSIECHRTNILSRLPKRINVILCWQHHREIHLTCIMLKMLKTYIDEIEMKYTYNIKQVTTVRTVLMVLILIMILVGL